MADILAIGAKKVSDDEKVLVEEETFQESTAPEKTEAFETYAETTVNSHALITETNNETSSSDSESSASITTYSGSETITESRQN